MLDYAHKQNLVHRDIEPANIMCDPDTDTPKVTDFGIAHITDSSKTKTKTKTKTGMVLGTPSFMSPEQLAGKKIEGASDLFSLGVSLYQMACGKLPFAGDSMAQLMFRIANEPHTDILSIKGASKNSDFIPTDGTTDMTTDGTTSHLTRLSKNDSQVLNYSHLTDETPCHSTRLSKNDNQVAGYKSPKGFA